MTNARTRREPVAIIGMGCRLPGDISTPAGLWDALIQERDCVTYVPEQRWETMVGRLHPDQVPERPFPAGVVEVEAFDHTYFGISADEAAEMDPQQKLLLETVHEALADASIPPASLAGFRIGVYVGAASTDQTAVNFGAGYRAGTFTSSGAGMAILANRVSHLLDLEGPSLTIDTACSSSLVALHQAVRDLRSGEVETAVVAGTNVLTSPVITASFVEAGVLAQDGRSKPFDQNADGYVRSEGTVVLILTRARTAQRKGQRVWAQVTGTATNHGGRSPHLLAPRIERQSAVIRRTLTDAGLSPGRVGWVQAHGTGTRAGDRVEATALAHALERKRPIPIGSVKGNLGHLEGCSGALGVMVAALAVHHGRIPPTLHHRALRPSLEGLVRVPTRVEDWPHHDQGEPRVAGVSSWGFGGSNAHAIISSAPTLNPPLAQDPMPLPETMVVSGHTPAALAHAAGRLAERAPAGGSVGTVADTALARGGHLRHRAAVVASDLGALVQGLRSIQDRAPNPDVVGPNVTPATQPEVVFVYSGHGGHHRHAGTNLMRLPVFAEAMKHARSTLSTHTGYAAWGPEQDVTSFQDAQHCTFLVQVALTRLLADRGIIPDVVLGHSVGEIAAAHAAGALSLDEAALVIARRSALLSGLSSRGSLLAVRAGVDETTTLLAPYKGQVTIASYSAPQVQVVAGSHEDLEHLYRVLTEQGVWCKPLPDVIPAHSPAVEPLRCALEEALEDLAPATPQVPMISTAHPDRMPSNPGSWGARYWANQARSPVRFTDAILAAAQSDNGDGVVFVEVGPRALLSEHITHTLDGDNTHHTVAATTDPSAFAHAIGELYTLGVTPTGPINRAHPSVVVAPGWDYTSTIMSEGREEERRSIPSPEEVPEHLASEVARLVHAAAGIDLGASWAGLGLDSHQLLQLTSRLRRIPAWRGVDVQLFLPDRPLAHVAADLADLVRHPRTTLDRAPTVVP